MSFFCLTFTFFSRSLQRPFCWKHFPNPPTTTRKEPMTRRLCERIFQEWSWLLHPSNPPEKGANLLLRQFVQLNPSWRNMLFSHYHQIELQKLVNHPRIEMKWIIEPAPIKSRLLILCLSAYSDIGLVPFLWIWKQQQLNEIIFKWDAQFLNLLFACSSHLWMSD